MENEYLNIDEITEPLILFFINISYNGILSNIN
jgi:hypothetical protein